MCSKNRIESAEFDGKSFVSKFHPEEFRPEEFRPEGFRPEGFRIVRCSAGRYFKGEEDDNGRKKSAIIIRWLL